MTSQIITDEGVTLSEEQSSAVHTMLGSSHACLVGSAGTGKTTTTNVLVQKLYKQYNTPDQLISMTTAVDFTRETKQHEVAEWNNFIRGECGDVVDLNQTDSVGHTLFAPMAMCSPSAKAAIRLSQSVPKQFQARCQTIHMMLGYYPSQEDKVVEKEVYGQTVQVQEQRLVYKPFFTKQNKMPWKVIVIDEAGMVGEKLMQEILDAALPDCRIYLVGDVQQLPPPMDRPVLPYAMHAWDVGLLTKVFRTNEASIINLADDILKGTAKLEAPADARAVKIINMKDAGVKIVDAMAVRNFVEGQLRGAYQAGFFNPIEDMLLLPQSTGELGADGLNKLLARMFNPGERIGVTSGSVAFDLRVGDRIMVTENMYSRGVVNGSLATVESIDPNPLTRIQQNDDMRNSFKNLSATLDNDNGSDARKHEATHIIGMKADNGSKVQFRKAGEYGAMLMGYAITCHKAQGSEARNVFVVISRHHNPSLLTREWLYTAVTRAVDRVCLIADEPSMRACAKNQALIGDTYEEKVANFMKKRSMLFSEKLIVLPDPAPIDVIDCHEPGEDRAVSIDDTEGDYYAN